VGSSQVLEWDVTSVLNASATSVGTVNGTYNFGLKTLSADRAEFISKEGGAGAPQLVIFGDAPTATNPIVHITAPADGAILTAAAPTPSPATATDPQDGNTASGLTWRSDKDGVLGTGASVNATLSRGAHVITATATDSMNINGADLIHVTVGTGAPTLSIVA